MVVRRIKAICMYLPEEWGQLIDSLHLAEYCLVIPVILASTAVALHLPRKRRTVKRRDVGPRLTRRQLGGAIAIIAIFWTGLLCIDFYIDRSMESWTFEEWATGNLHLLFLAVLCPILLLGRLGVAARQDRKAETPESVPEPESESPWKGSRSDRARLIVIVVVLVVLVTVWVIPFPFTETYNQTYLERIPYNVTQTYSAREPHLYNRTLESPLQISPGAQFLRDYPINAPPGDVVHILCDMHLEAYNNTLTGEIREGGDMDFYIFNNTEYAAWSEGRKSQPYLFIEQVKNANFQFIPNQSETYHVVIDNRLSSLNKTAKITLIHSWAEEVSESSYVTRTRNITRYNETLRTLRLTRRKWATLAKRWFH